MVFLEFISSLFAILQRDGLSFMSDSPKSDKIVIAAKIWLVLLALLGAGLVIAAVDAPGDSAPLFWGGVFAFLQSFTVWAVLMGFSVLVKKAEIGS